MAITINGSGTVTGITGITGTNATVTGITSVASNAANTPVILQDSSSNSATCRAWVSLNGTTNTNLTGTYSQSGTVVTVTATAHGLSTGQETYLDFTSGTAIDGSYTVTVTGANTFTLTQASRTTSGNVTLVRNTIRGSFNVSSVSDNGVGTYTVNLINPMPDANYVIAGSADSVPLCYSNFRGISLFYVVTASASESPTDSTNTSVAIFR